MFSKISALPDLFITIPTILLLSLGILVIYSSDIQLAVFQLSFAIVGLAIFWFLSFIDFEAYNEYSKYLYVFILGLLIVVFLIGIETRGSLRWIPIGPFKIQPSEFAKPALILMLARFWSYNLPSWKNILKSFMVVLPLFGLIFLQPDLGTSLTLVVIWVVMLIGANASLLKLVFLGIGACLITPIGWLFLKDYQKDRIITFLSPAHDPLGVSYNVIQAMIAVGSGQFSGRGLGRGTQSRLQFLPEYRTDFIFASIAEELGFIGSVIVLGLYGLIISRCFWMMAKLQNRFSMLVVIGVLGMVFFQVAVNIGMNLGVVPVTGITLPLISYGGSSLIATLVCLGFIGSISRFNQKPGSLKIA